MVDSFFGGGAPRSCDLDLRYTTRKPQLPGGDDALEIRRVLAPEGTGLL
jgi:hypothetical protein